MFVWLNEYVGVQIIHILPTLVIFTVLALLLGNKEKNNKSIKASIFGLISLGFSIISIITIYIAAIINNQGLPYTIGLLNIIGLILAFIGLVIKNENLKLCLTSIILNSIIAGLPISIVYFIFTGGLA